MRNHATGAVLDAAFGVAEIAAAVLSERVERTVAEQAVEPFGVLRFVAREIFALGVLKKGIVFILPMFHFNPPGAFPQASCPA